MGTLMKKIMLVHKNSVKQQIRMGSHQEDFSNPRHNLSMTRSMQNPLLSLERTNKLGLVLMPKGTIPNGFTQAVELILALKIGTQVNQIITHMIVSIGVMGIMVQNGLIMIAMKINFSFVSLSN